MYFHLFILAVSKSSEPLFDTPTTVAICALIVSIVGIVFGVLYNRRSLELTEKHNMLSVIPQINYDNNSDRINNKESGKISNPGLGPALIKKIIYYHDGMEYSSYDKLIKKEFKDIYPYMIHDKSTFSHMSNPILPPNSTKLLFDMTFKFDIEYKDWHFMSKKCGVFIEYESLYGEKFNIRYRLNNPVLE